MAWGKTPYSNEELLGLRVGDVVTIDQASSAQATAPIVRIERMWGTDMLPRITLDGHVEDWTAHEPGGSIDFSRCRQCGAHMVTHIVSKAVYRPGARGDYEELYAKFPYERDSWNHPRNSGKKGVLCARYGEMQMLFWWALCQLPIRFTRYIDENRAIELWRQAGQPGYIRSEAIFAVATPHAYVREKPFMRFVRQNYSKFLMSAKAMHALADERYEQDAQDFAEAVTELAEMHECGRDRYELLDEENRRAYDSIGEKIEEFFN